MADSSVPESTSAQTYEVVITLLDVGVDVDRRVLAPDSASLADLHLIIQAAMGWENYHLHAFTGRNGTVYSDTSLDEPGEVDDSSVRLADVLREPGDALDYEYDFGDSWQHRVELVAVRAEEGPGAVVPACIDGRGACPPEDCGGAWSYREICEARHDPGAHELPWDELPWWAEKWDSSAFDLAEANRALRLLALSEGARPRA